LLLKGGGEDPQFNDGWGWFGGEIAYEQLWCEKKILKKILLNVLVRFMLVMF